MKLSNTHRLIHNDDGSVVGLAIADHRIHRRFDIEEFGHALGVGRHGRIGVDAIRARVPDVQRDRLVFFHSTPRCAVLVLNAGEVERIAPMGATSRHIQPSRLPELDTSGHGPDHFASYATGDGIVVVAHSAPGRALLHDLHQALCCDRFAVAYAHHTPFYQAYQGHLLLLITDRLTPAIVARMEADTMEDLHMRMVDHDLGIRDRLIDAGLSYHALRPSGYTSLADLPGLRDDPQRLAAGSRHPLVYYLNPGQQHIHRSGWFTVEELDAWTRGEGPVMKRADA